MKLRYVVKTYDNEDNLPFYRVGEKELQYYDEDRKGWFYPDVVVLDLNRNEYETIDGG